MRVDQMASFFFIVVALTVSTMNSVALLKATGRGAAAEAEAVAAAVAEAEALVRCSFLD
jgi:hypothetical protein